MKRLKLQFLFGFLALALALLQSETNVMAGCNDYLSYAVELDSEFIGETVGQSAFYKKLDIDRRVVYFNPQELMKNEIKVVEGALYARDLPSLEKWVKMSNTQYDFMFVLTTDKKFYARFRFLNEIGVFEHSSFTSGKPVLAAGFMRVFNGQIYLINTKSYQYPKQTEENQKILIQYLKDNGYDTQKIEFQTEE
jgi:hypothetical protein